MAQIECINAFKYKGKIYENYHDAKIARNEDIGNRLYKMYDRYGELTSDFDCATFVYLQTEQATSQFIDDCKENGVISYGIEERDTGLFLWNEYTNEYGYLDIDSYKGMYNVLAQLLNN